MFSFKWLKEQASPNSSSCFIKVLSKKKVCTLLCTGNIFVADNFRRFFCQKLTLSKRFASNVYVKYLFLCCPNICTLFLYKIFISYILDCTVDHGPWTMDSGLWTMDWGQWTMDCGLSTVGCGPKTQDSRPRTEDPGLRTEEQGSRIQLRTDN